MTIRVRGIEDRDRERWAELYLGYLEFYQRTNDGQLETVWAWIRDDSHETMAFVAVDTDDDRPLAIAHAREFARPSSGGRGLYLDDLFTDPTARGQGASSALLEHLRRLAGERGLNVVRWITAADNATAQSVYDKLATKTPWVTYDMGVDV